MKIALIVPSLSQKAPVLVARDLAEGYVQLGHQVKVFYFDDITEVTFPCIAERISFFDIKKTRGFDIVHTHMIRPDTFGFIARSLLATNAKFVSTIHNIVEEDLRFSYGNVISKIFSKIWRFVWHHIDGRVVLTEQALSYYHSSQPGDLFTKIYNGRASHNSRCIDEADESRVTSLKIRYRILGSCAVIGKRKGLDQAIRALRQLDQYALLIVGDGPALDELQQLSINLGVEDRVLMLGRRNNARDFLPFMDVYAMPSRSEGLPLALLEAVSAGVPVVCSNIPQFQEVFTEDEVSFFDLDDIDGFVNAVHLAEANGQMLSERARSRYQRCYTQQVMVNNYLSYFDQLLKSTKAV